MTRVLLTGMSGTGKSSVIARLAALGHEAIDADTDAWSEWAIVPMPGAPAGSAPVLDWAWREDRMQELLDRPRDGALFVSGCAPNQGRFHDRFDCIVLLSAPAEVIMERVLRRTTNSFGKAAEERAKILTDLRAVEPMLRRGADIEIDTATTPLDAVVEQVASIGAS